MPKRRKSRQETGVQSRLHESALTINGITPQRTVVKYNRYTGDSRTYVVLGYPVVLTTITRTLGSAPEHVKTVPEGAHVIHGPALMAKMRDTATGRVGYKYLSDLGVVPNRAGRFNAGNFLIDHRKRHLLPTQTIPRPYPHRRLPLRSSYVRIGAKGRLRRPR